MNGIPSWKILEGSLPGPAEEELGGTEEESQELTTIREGVPKVGCTWRLMELSNYVEGSLRKGDLGLKRTSWFVLDSDMYIYIYIKKAGLKFNLEAHGTK